MDSQNPYESPVAETDPHIRSNKRFRLVRSISGIVIVIAILAGISGAVFGINSAFRELAVAETVDPKQLSDRISTSLRYGAIAIPIAIIAFVFRSWATMSLRRDGGIPAKYKRRRRMDVFPE